MSNPHISSAAGHIEVAQAVARQIKGNPTVEALATIAVAEATLAVAYELRTANLLAISQHPETGAATTMARYEEAADRVRDNTPDHG